LEDRRSVGASSCNCGDGTDRRVQSLMFMVMMMIPVLITFHDILYIRTRPFIISYHQMLHASKTTVSITSHYACIARRPNIYSVNCKLYGLNL
jgi:hypothetical protein